MATLALVPQVVDAVGEKVPVVAAGGLFNGPRPGGIDRARGRRGVDRNPLHRHPRGRRAVAGYKDALLGLAEDGTVISKSYTGKTCPRGAQRVDQLLRTAPSRTAAVPAAGNRQHAGRREPSRR